MKKRFLSMATVVMVSILAITGCSTKKTEDNNTEVTEGDLSTVKVAAISEPQFEILEQAKEAMKDKGYELEVVEFYDYIQPHLALSFNDVDATYIQHAPFYFSFNSLYDTDIVPVDAIHYELFGLYAGKVSNIDDLPVGARIGVPADTTNRSRAILLLDKLGVITVDDNTNLSVTEENITENPLNIEVFSIDSSQLVEMLPDVDMAIINGDYAIKGGLNPKTDAVALEEAEGFGSQIYGNVLAVSKGHENDKKITALVDVLKSDEISTFIEEKYNGNIIPIFE